MALPTNLATKLKSIPMDPTALATDLELAYLLSFAQHRTYLVTQPSPASRSTYILVNPTIRLWNTTSMPSSRIKYTSSFSNKQPKTTSLRTGKSQEASDAASRNSMLA